MNENVEAERGLFDEPEEPTLSPGLAFRGLPPANPNAAHMRADLPAPPPAPARPRFMPPGTRDDAKIRLEDAAKRARSLERVQAVRKTLNFGVDVEVYEALVELAERTRTPVSKIARRCLVDGLKRYSDFRLGFDPFEDDPPFTPTDLLNPKGIPIRDAATDPAKTFRSAVSGMTPTPDELAATRAALDGLIPKSPPVTLQ